MLYCIAGRAVAECNFSDTPFREGHMAIIFSDTLFAIKKISLGLESALADRLAENLTKSISASRKLLNGFYKLLS